MDQNTFMIVVVAVVAVVGAITPFLFMWMNGAGTARVNQRLASNEESSGDDPEVHIDSTYGEDDNNPVDRWFHRLVSETGMDLSPEAAFLISVATGLVLGGILFVWRQDVVAGLAGLFIGFSVVIAFLMIRRARRRRQIRDQLPEVMELLARAVRAGESLDQAISLVGDSMTAPLGPEFRRCSKQLEMGLSMDSTMRSLSRRARLTEIRILAAALMVQRQAGGNLPITLERLGRVIRDRLSYHRQFRAATAAGRISTIMIGLAGPLVAAYTLIWNKEDFQKFLAVPLGQLMLGIAIGLQILGLLWVYAILRNDY